MGRTISVILPVYNSELFLTETIYSILNQTFSDFELLIINDGSTDRSEEIILSFSDERIRYITNNGNKGLIYSLNHAISLSSGIYIARIDADDICTPQRLEKQKAFLDTHTNVAVVGSTITFINETGDVAGDWPLDRQTVTYPDIKKIMPRENILTHPSIMMRKTFCNQYHYASYQKNIEDYDLWLRALADGIHIEKINESLLFYRVHNTSVTKKILQKKNAFFKMSGCKRRFLWHRILAVRWGFFETTVFIYMIRDVITGIGKEVKQKLFYR